MNNNEKSKFEFDEFVNIKTSDPKEMHINTKQGFIAGKSCNEKGLWNYGVLIFDLEEVWCFDENELESTGNFVTPMESIGSVKVLVYENGKGKIKDD